jgi:hypothetical protein
LEREDNESIESSQLLAKMANEAVKEAIAEHHRNGRSVFYAENGNLVEHTASGEKNVIKKLEVKEKFSLRKYLER